MKTKKWIMEMTWSEVPIWICGLTAATVLSWILMWPAKAYVGQWLATIFLSLWAIGSIGFFIVGIFFSYQTPRNVK